MNKALTVRDLQPAEVESVRLFPGLHGWGHRTGAAEYFAHLNQNSQCTARLKQGMR
ncbi:hypothetical protein [Pseudomonas sp. FP2196]|uniref:hypothetical protein n=1 Tax=Pseudomonas sp. FP2196 TaxID=2954086 RepID=UPI003522A689